MLVRWGDRVALLFVTGRPGVDEVVGPHCWLPVMGRSLDFRLFVRTLADFVILAQLVCKICVRVQETRGRGTEGGEGAGERERERE